MKFAAILAIAVLAACGGNDEDESIDTTSSVCLVKATPPGQEPQPLPDYCKPKK